MVINDNRVISLKLKCYLHTSKLLFAFNIGRDRDFGISYSVDVIEFLDVPNLKRSEEH